MFKRIARFFRMLASIFFDFAEESVPLERRLAYDRQEKAGKLKGMMDRATDVGEAAEMMVQALAGARITATNVRDEVRAHLSAAKAAANRGDKTTEQNEQAAAANLADDLAEAENEIAELEQLVNETLKDKKDARDMVLNQARELERLARQDARLIARVRVSEMRGQALQLREAMLQLVPEDRDDIRQRAREKAQKAQARVAARTELVDALWQQKQRGIISRSAATSSRGRDILAQISEEVGYQPSAAQAQTESQDTKRLEQQQ